MANRRRKRRSRDDIVDNTALISSLLPWWGSLVVGLLLFGVFYFLIPSWIGGMIESERDSHLFPALEAIVEFRVEIFRAIGFACLLVSAYFSIRNLTGGPMSTNEERKGVSFIAKMLGRYID